MANIDTSTIEGYEGMTPEQKVSALEAFTLPEPDLSGYVSKATFDKTASDLSKVKKSLAERMTDEEKNAKAAAEAAEEKNNQIAELTRKVAVHDYTAQFLAAGYPEELAQNTAEAMADGKLNVVFENQKKYLGIRDASIKAELLKQTPPPVGDGGNVEVDYNAKAQEAMDAGDAALASHYLRLAAKPKK